MHYDLQADQARVAAHGAILVRVGLVNPAAQRGDQRRRDAGDRVRRARSSVWSPWPAVSDDLRPAASRRVSSPKGLADEPQAGVLT